MASRLFSPLRIRGLEFKNRIFMSPMDMFCAADGMFSDWHFVHYSARAAGGVALIIQEATAVSEEGRISPGDLGIWSERQARALRRVTDYLKKQGTVAGIQLAHAGRKGAVGIPWQAGDRPLMKDEGAWETMGPSAIPYAPNFAAPREMSPDEIEEVIAQFSAAARRAIAAGYEFAEIHMAHGYLCHQFLSPVANRRKDDYGGSFDNRVRFPLRIAECVRSVWPENLPVCVRISATDWLEGGWDLQQTVAFAKRLKAIGIDMIDCSSGGMSPDAKIPAGPGFQTPFAAAVRNEVKIPTAAVGYIREPFQAEQIIANGHADAVMLGRELLRNPYWPLHAAKALKAEVSWPPQYVRGKT